MILEHFRVSQTQNFTLCTSPNPQKLPKFAKNFPKLSKLVTLCLNRLHLKFFNRGLTSGSRPAISAGNSQSQVIETSVKFRVRGRRRVVFPVYQQSGNGRQGYERQGPEGHEAGFGCGRETFRRKLICGTCTSGTCTSGTCRGT